MPTGNDGYGAADDINSVKNGRTTTGVGFAAMGDRFKD
jgi:hypothetical protein